ncbi:unnamed protein product [Hymenolepis diminuta]|uniref:protein-tyrosine-phosphatase n=1 Tax=Hymenolepis diminuta TaxID=6216 RepID=A0A0R3SA87_HYMDI|nr:unnamed protein product [Hymenolepis diminuta]VUZ46659.1 unnamed protein product [Hymenolepis diminuta]
MDPTRYPGRISEISRQNRRNECMAKYYPEPELMDECANQEAPPIPNAFKFMRTTDQENTVSSGYVSGASSNQPFYGEPFIHYALEPMEVTYPTPSKRNVRFSDKILSPALKRLKRWDSPNPNRQVLREIQVADTSMEEINVPRPSLMRSATVPFPSPMLTDSSTRLSLEKPKSVLPVVKTSTHGTDMVSVHTVAQLVRGEYEKLNVTHTIIDCRYPYEYEAGHIKGALNLYTSSDVVKEIFKKAPAASFNDGESFMDLGPSVDELIEGQNPAVRLPTVRSYMPRNFSSDDSDGEDSLSEERRSEAKRQSSDDEKIPMVSVPEADPNAPPTHVLIFHCEFSSQRGPELSRFLRKVDRYINYPRYPFVFYPHVYVMLGGYASFYKEYPELCEPRNYLKMFEKGFKDELTYYSKLTKEVSNTCTACFKDSKLVNLKISPSMEDKEKKPILRSVQTMLPGPQLQKVEELFEGTSGSMNEISPKKGVSRAYLQLAEHIIRKGSHVIDAYEYFRHAGTDALAKEMLVGFVPTEREEKRAFGTLSGPLKPVARLSFSSDDDVENRPPQQLSGPRPKAVLDFSESDEATDTSAFL